MTKEKDSANWFICYLYSMRNLFLLFFFLPSFCFCQERLVSSEDDIWINAKLNANGITDIKLIDSVLGKPDSIYRPVFDVLGIGLVDGDTIASYPNADFEMLYGKYYMSSATFTKRTKEFFVNFGTQILTCETTMDDVKKNFYIWPFVDSTDRTEIISGRLMKVRSIEIYNPDPTVSDPPTWRFNFFENKLIRITFVSHGA